jgi:two-component system autoinducer 1 sensor kinase/phosphatase LuxN
MPFGTLIALSVALDIHTAELRTAATMRSILFADDNKNIREFCKQELEDEGYRVLLARDGAEAARLVQKEHIDLAILDINMPIVNGFEAAQRIKAIAPAIPIMFFTAHDEDCIRDHRSRLAAACVEKTDDLAELKQVAARLLTSRDGNEQFRSGLPPPSMSPTSS